MFFGQFASKNWFSENWLKFGTVAHCYILISNLMFIFSKNFHSFFGANLVSKLQVFQINRNFVQECIALSSLRFKCLFFQKFFSYIFLCKFGPKIWGSIKWPKFRTGVHCCILITILIFFFTVFVNHIFWTNLVSKFKVFQIDWNFVQGYIATYLLRF